MANVSERTDGEIGRPLHVLVPLIKEELAQGLAAGMEHYRRAGEMLLEAKEQLERGEWKPWLSQNFHLSQNTAGLYMQLVKTETLRGLRFSSLQDFRNPGRSGHQKAEWVRPVRQITRGIDVQRLAEERATRAQEAALSRDLGLKLVAIGYKVLSTRLHPDKRGGSNAAMARLVKVRDFLKQALEREVF